MHIEGDQRCEVNSGKKAYAPVRIEASVAGAGEAYAPVRIEASEAGGTGAEDAKASAPVRIEGRVVEAGRVGEAKAYAPVRIEGRVAERSSLGTLSDVELLDSTLVASAHANRAVVALLAHLAEVETRGVHRLCACSSLYTYCRYELGMPEDTAQRRALAARLVRRFPQLLDKLASGELHLSGLLLLGPHLKHENLEQLLDAAKHRSKREILSLVRQFDPRPDVPARIEPLGPAPRARSMAANAAGVHADTDAGAGAEDGVGGPGPVSRTDAGAGSGADTSTAPGTDAGAGSGADTSTDADAGAGSGLGLESGMGARGGAVEQRFKVQFTAGEEYVRLLQEAQELLGPGENGHVVAEVHLRAMRLLVRELKKRKCALVDKPRPSRVGTSTHQRGSDDAEHTEPREVGARDHRRNCAESGDDTRQSARMNDDDPHRRVPPDGATDRARPHRRVSPDGATGRARSHRRAASVDDGEDPRRSGPTLDDHEDPHRSVCAGTSAGGAALEESRYLPAEVRRSVWERDGGRCAFVDGRGRRCRERSGLEFHHEIAFAKGGRHKTETVSLRCRAHNALAAEQDFGTEHMARWSQH
ncbi:MAG: hypothetical protein R3B13_39740 [Polyangiaceae bacterium]